MNYDRPELLDRLASEYVLGTLHGGARRRFRRLLRELPRAADAVRRWESRLVPMAESLDGPAPPDRVWAGIAGRIAPAAGGAPARAAGADARAASGRGLGDALRDAWARWFGWQGLSTLAAGVVIGVGVALLAPALRDAATGTQHAATQLPESYAGFLADGQGRTTLLVSSLRHGRIVDLKVLRPIEVPAGRTLRLWALRPDAPPLALGEVPAQGKGRLELPDTSERLLSRATELAVSVEAPGPTPPAPTLPYLLRGPCAKFW